MGTTAGSATPPTREPRSSRLAPAFLVVSAALVVGIAFGQVLLLPVLTLLLAAGARTHLRLQRRHDDLQLLYDFTRDSGSEPQLGDAVAALLSQVRTVMRAEVAVFVLGSTEAGGLLHRTCLRGDGELTTTRIPMDALWARILASGTFTTALADDDGLREALAEHGASDAIAAPLRRPDGTIIGMVLAGDRIGQGRPFGDDDRRIFEALANHAAVTIENRHLVDRLRDEAADREHQALHDALTGLPNRVLFHARVGAVLDTVDASEGQKVAVMLLDLDRFKEVNDTLGHHNGDLLLQEIALRLRRTLRAGDTVARLGGDEFAVLLPDLAGAEAAVAVANGIRQALQRPFDIGELILDVGASIGIALWPDHGHEPLLLLQRAEVAMYEAKTSQTGVAVYDAEADTYSLDRLALVGELRQAIEHNELAVHYQPKADVRSGEVVGMEALVRWNHPRRGFVSPEEIIQVAEQTGLIRPLTHWVLRQALLECRRWRQDGHAFDVAVNLSFRNVLDPDLIGDVQRMLDEVGLPSSALTFEITESSMMVEPERTVAVLARLRSAGIGLAIDDFGTGYSSFSHLRHLPVDEIKIDRSFVTHMATDDSDAMIVRTIVDLGSNLGLRVVAEGVEDQGAWDRLGAAGCHVGQGYLLSRPMAPADLHRWLLEHQVVAAKPLPPAEVGKVVPLRSQGSR